MNTQTVLKTDLHDHARELGLNSVGQDSKAQSPRKSKPQLRWRKYRRTCSLATGYRLMAWRALRCGDEAGADMNRACSDAFRTLDR